MEAVHRLRQLLLLRLREPEVLPAAGRDHARQPGGGELLHRTDDEQRRKWIVGVAVTLDLLVLAVVQVLRVLHPEHRRHARPRRARDAAAAADDRAAGRRQLLHLPGDLVHGRRQAPAGRARQHDRRRALPELLPPPRGRPDRARPRVPAAAAVAARPEQGRGRLRAGADRARAGQEGRDRRLPGAHDRRPRVRRAGVLRRAGRVDGRVRLHGADLLRLLRLHRHRDRARAADGLRVPAELHVAVPLARVPRLLAALAHDAQPLPARLPLHPARRQPQRQVEDATATCS